MEELKTSLELKEAEKEASPAPSGEKAIGAGWLDGDMIDGLLVNSQEFCSRCYRRAKVGILRVLF